MMSSYMPALTGIRFFAIFHIFLHHLWAVYHYEGGEGQKAQGIFSELDSAPHWLIAFMQNGWVSTSLFFLLSGFMMGRLYWQQNGQLSISKQEFWLLRFARIYPAHLIVLVLLIVLKMPAMVAEGQSLMHLIGSVLASGLLIQAWVPPWVPPWNWPAWTISALTFLYLVFPYLVRPLARMSAQKQKTMLQLLPFVALLPTLIYIAILEAGVSWSLNIGIFFSNTPLFWLPWFVAGLLMTRVMSNKPPAAQKSAPLMAWGDLAFCVVIFISLIPDIHHYAIQAIKFWGLMPIYLVIIRDLARGHGLISKVFSTRIMIFLGDAGFSIFIWQSVIITLAFGTLYAELNIGPHQTWLAVVLVLVVSVISNHFIEKPLAKSIKLRLITKFSLELKPRPSTHRH